MFVSGDRQAWIEVQTAEGEWVSVDPNPEPRDIPEREPDEPTIVSRPQSALPPPAERTPVDDLDSDPELALDRGDDGTEPWVEALLGALAISGFVVLGLAVLVSPFLAIIVAKLRRRRLRRLAPTRWSASRADGRSSPTRPPTTATRSAQRPPGPSRRPRSAGSRRSCSPRSWTVRSSHPTAPSDGDDLRVWSTVDELQDRLAAPRSRRERILAAISLTSLGGYAVTRRGAKP